MEWSHFVNFKQHKLFLNCHHYGPTQQILRLNKFNMEGREFHCHFVLIVKFRVKNKMEVPPTDIFPFI